jgi:hypothetical protein
MELHVQINIRVLYLRYEISTLINMGAAQPHSSLKMDFRTAMNVHHNHFK